MRQRSPLRRVIIYAGALLLAIFWFAPFVLVASRQRDAGGESALVSAALVPDPLNLQTYDYIFTGKIPQSYEQRGALRSMISNEVRDVPRAICNSFLVATAVMFINLIFGSLAAYAYARMRFPGRAAPSTSS